MKTGNDTIPVSSEGADVGALMALIESAAVQVTSAVILLQEFVTTIEALDRCTTVEQVGQANAARARALESAKAFLAEIDSDDSGFAAHSESRLSVATRDVYEDQVDGSGYAREIGDQRDSAERRAPVGERAIHSLAQHVGRPSPDLSTPPEMIARTAGDLLTRCAYAVCGRELRPRRLQFVEQKTGRAFCDVGCFDRQQAIELKGTST